MQLDPITVHNAWFDRCTQYPVFTSSSFDSGATHSGPRRCQPVKSDDHSGVEPLLPISNRTVKRASADDSRVRPGESRSSSDSYKTPTPRKGRSCFGEAVDRSGLMAICGQIVGICIKRRYTPSLSKKKWARDRPFFFGGLPSDWRLDGFAGLA